MNELVKVEAGNGRRRLAVVLFNLGGPDSLEAVEPYLFNLFSDPYIIHLPQPFRWVLAKWISRRRGPLTRDIYRQINNRSPLLAETLSQAAALKEELENSSGMKRAGAEDFGYREVGVFPAMRYWHPFAAETVRKVREFDPERIVLLPLYPQHSTATTASALADWRRAAAIEGLYAPATAICCYPLNPGFITANVENIMEALAAIEEGVRPRILFSAHGLPEKFIDNGDPYAWQMHKTVAAVTSGLRARTAAGVFETSLCFQSRVGALKWLSPSIDEEIRRAGNDGLAVIVVPIAFVSEHSETQVELDIKYRALAGEVGVPQYLRVPTVGVHPKFISGLAGMVRAVAERPERIGPAPGCGACPSELKDCPLAERRA